MGGAFTTTSDCTGLLVSMQGDRHTHMYTHMCTEMHTTAHVYKEAADVSRSL